MNNISRKAIALSLLSASAIILSSIIIAQDNKKPAGGQYIITGNATETQEVISGIRPTEEMEKEWKKAKPSANKTFYIRKGSINKYTKKVYRIFKTDSLGNFKISLPPGNYCIIEKPKRDRLKIPDYTPKNKQLRNFEQYQVGDKKCFDDWYALCDATIEVKDKNISGFTFNIHHAWNPPCISGGPLPQ